MPSDVTRFYENKNIFITGGTGFLGIAIIEKILRSCPTSGNIYLLMRPKRGKSIEERLEELTNNKVFETILGADNSSKSKQDVFKKLIAIPGDVNEEHLGLSDEDRQRLITNVNIVLHSAATLDFHESLIPTVQTNILGTRRVMELATECKNIVAMVHVSSAYVNSYQLDCEEILYPAPGDVEKIINFATTLNEPTLLELQPSLIKDHPNSYTFTKHFAEHEVNKCAKKFPCGIVRPSMITSAWKEPVPGWTISKNGPQGFLMGASTGVIRRLPVGMGLVYDYIPVDVVVNQILLTAYDVHQKKSNEITIFHCTSSTCNPFKWEEVTDKINGLLHKYPLRSAFWYPTLKFVSSIFLFKISAILFHFIPGYIADGIARLAGGKPRLIRLHTNVWNSLMLLEKFIFTEWKFHNPNTLALINSCSAADKEIFYIDIKTLNWEDYFLNLTQGVRKFLHKEDPKTLPAARRKDMWLMVIHLLVQALFFGGIWWIGSCILDMPMRKTGFIVPIVYFLFNLL